MSNESAQILWDVRFTLIPRHKHTHTLTHSFSHQLSQAFLICTAAVEIELADVKQFKLTNTINI